MNKNLSFCIVLSTLFIIGCKNNRENDINNNNSPVDSESEYIKDKTENSNEIAIGNQIWSTKNLEVTTFRNGDPILEAEWDLEWDKAGRNQEPAWCYYDNDPSNENKYGKLYNWYAIIDERGLIPKCWHVPSKTEWERLVDFLGGQEVAGKKMKNIEGWDENGNGTNESGFCGLPGGSRFDDGDFFGGGRNGEWWSSSEKNMSEGETVILYYWLDEIGPDKKKWSVDSKSEGRSIRCIKDY